MFTSYREIVRKFPSDPESMDNRWLERAVFNNSNIKAKIKNHKNQGYKLELLTTEYYKLPTNLKLKSFELYKGGKFIDEENLEALIH